MIEIENDTARKIKIKKQKNNRINQNQNKPGSIIILLTLRKNLKWNNEFKHLILCKSLFKYIYIYKNRCLILV